MVRQSPTLKKSDDQYAGLLTTAQAAAFLGYKPRMLEVSAQEMGRLHLAFPPGQLGQSCRLDAWVDPKSNRRLLNRKRRHHNRSSEVDAEEKTKTQFIVTGPNDFFEVINPDSIGVVLRRGLDWPYDQSFSVRCIDMTEVEIVAQALGIEAYPK